MEGATAAVTPPAPAPGFFASRWPLLILLAIAVLVLFAVSPLVGLIALVAAGLIVAAALRKTSAPESGGPTVADLLSPAGLSPGAIALTPAQPAFTYAGPVEATLPPSSAPPPGPPAVPGDSVAAADMRRALTDFQDVLAVRGRPSPPKPALDLDPGARARR